MTSERLNAFLYHLDLKLLHPFDTASGRVDRRSVGLVSVSRGTLTGWGEAAPYPHQDEPFSDVLEAAAAGRMTPTLAAALDEAVCDLVARERGESMSHELGPARTTVPISVAVGMGTHALADAQRAVDAGIRAIKVKIEPGRTDHVEEIRRLDPTLAIGVDANGSFDALSTGEILRLARFDISYVEQPFPLIDSSGIAALAEAGMSVFLDESVRSTASAAAALAVGGVDGIVVKPGRLGWQTSVNVVRLARGAGKRWKASGLLESGVGRSYTVALASAEDSYMSDIAPADWFMEYDPSPLTVEGAEIVVSTGPGSGVVVDPAEIRRRCLAEIPLSGSVGRDPC